VRALDPVVAWSVLQNMLLQVASAAYVLIQYLDNEKAA
jgi:hypothetical protein